jgi:Tol biopolymer transport system component
MFCSIKLHRFITILFIITTALALLVIGTFIFLSYKLGNGFISIANAPSTNSSFSSFPPSYLASPAPSSTQLFLSTITNGKTIKVFFYDLTNHTLHSERTIPVSDGELGLSSYEAEGANDVIQYNPSTHEILYATSKGEDMLGGCSDKKKCSYQIFKVAADATTSTIFFTTSTVEEPAHWLINTSDNTLILSFEKPGQQVIKILSLATGNIILEKELPLPDAENTHQLSLSRDGKKLFQTYNEFLTTGPRQIQNLYLREITLATGEYQDHQVISDALVLSFETTVSPEGKQLAFYTGEFSAPHLTIYNTQTKKLYTIPFQGAVSNVHLNWTDNGTELLYRLKDHTTLFNFSTRKPVALPTNIEKANVVWTVDQTGYYILYEYPRDHLTIYDKTTERSFEFPFSVPSLKGILFF